MNNFYARQVILPFVGISGQEKLNRAKVLIVGAGGLGHPCALYLAGSGVGTIGIVDFDKVDYTNLHRQIIFTPKDVDMLKSEVLACNISKQNPNIKTITHNVYLDSLNIQNIFSNYDIILDCCDNLQTKFLLHDTCFKFKKTLIQGSIDQIEGELKVFVFSTKENYAPCLRCLWDKIPENNCVDACSKTGVLPTTAGVFGTLMANEAVKIILKIEHLTNGESFILDLRSLISRKIIWKKNLYCPLCAEEKNYNEMKHPYELSYHHITNLTDYQVIDLRSSILVPDEVDTEKKYLLVCEKGITSSTHAKILREEGLTNIWSLIGGASCLSLIK